MFVSHLYVFFGKMSVYVFFPLFDLIVHFLVWNCVSCLYILEINPLSVVSFVFIFSHSEGCVFTLFIVSFAVQKLLCLIKSHLFTFVCVSNYSRRWVIEDLALCHQVFCLCFPLRVLYFLVLHLGL